MLVGWYRNVSLFAVFRTHTVPSISLWLLQSFALAFSGVLCALVVLALSLSHYVFCQSVTMTGSHFTVLASCCLTGGAGADQTGLFGTFRDHDLGHSVRNVPDTWATQAPSGCPGRDQPSN